MANAYKTSGDPGSIQTSGLETVTPHNVEEFGNAGMRPLHIALRAGKPEDLTKIIALGANPYAKSDRSQFPQDNLLPPDRFIELFERGSHAPDKYEMSASLRTILKAAQGEADEILLINLHLFSQSILQAKEFHTPDIAARFSKVAMEALRFDILPRPGHEEHDAGLVAQVGLAFDAIKPDLPKFDPSIRALEQAAHAFNYRFPQPSA